MDTSVQRSVQSSPISVEGWIDKDGDDCSLLGMLGMKNQDVIEQPSDHSTLSHLNKLRGASLRELMTQERQGKKQSRL